MIADFRKLLDDKAISALVIATPHHWHMPIGLRALAAVTSSAEAETTLPHHTVLHFD